MRRRYYRTEVGYDALLNHEIEVNGRFATLEDYLKAYALDCFDAGRLAADGEGEILSNTVVPHTRGYQIRIVWEDTG